jgi:hypothetical protein
MVPVTGHIRSENYSYTQRPDVGHVQMAWRSYGGKPVLIFWITMNRPGPLCGRPSTCIRVAMQILRHSRVAITMEIYTEVPSAVTREALRKLGQWLEDTQT